MLLLRRRIMLQFHNEAGIGYGVEREVVSVISKLISTPSTSTNDANNAHVDGSNRQTDEHCLFQSLGDDSYIHAPVPVNEYDHSGTTRKHTKKRARVYDDMDGEEGLDTVCHSLKHFEWFGMFVAHLLLRHVAAAKAKGSERAESGIQVLSFNISSVFWKLVLGKDISFGDLAGVDAVLYQNLQYLLNHEGASELSLTFTICEEGSNTDIELVKGGANKNVTDKNKKKYVDLIVQHRIYNRYISAAEAVRRGLLTILPEYTFTLFAEDELGLLLGGTVELDVAEWENTSKTVGYDVGDLILKWFWKLVRDIDSNERALLLR